MDDRLVKSHSAGRNCSLANPKSLTNDSTVATDLACVRQGKMRLAPCTANRLAASKPIPELAPVNKNVLGEDMSADEIDGSKANAESMPNKSEDERATPLAANRASRLVITVDDNDDSLDESDGVGRSSVCKIDGDCGVDVCGSFS